jgi:hypothetical protein
MRGSKSPINHLFFKHADKIKGRVVFVSRCGQVTYVEPVGYEHSGGICKVCHYSARMLNIGLPVESAESEEDVLRRRIVSLQESNAAMEKVLTGVATALGVEQGDVAGLGEKLEQLISTGKPRGLSTVHGLTAANLIPPMVDPRGRSWGQPDRDRITFKFTPMGNRAIMTTLDLDKLAEYGTDYPSSVYAGKMWKKRQGADRWALCWYGPADASGTYPVWKAEIEIVYPRENES